MNNNKQFNKNKPQQIKIEQHRKYQLSNEKIIRNRFVQSKVLSEKKTVEF